jgi:hypothetical protein
VLQRSTNRRDELSAAQGGVLRHRSMQLYFDRIGDRKFFVRCNAAVGVNASGGRWRLINPHFNPLAHRPDCGYIFYGQRGAGRLENNAGSRRCHKHEKKTSWGKPEYQMNNSTKILYNHLKDYPTSTEGYHDVSIPAVAAALRFENRSKNESRETPPRTDVQEKSGRR